MGMANLAALLACGLAMGLGSIGSGWGLGYAAQGAIRGMARQPKQSSLLFRNMLVGQAITETPAIFALVISFLLYFNVDRHLSAPWSTAQAAAFLGAGICMGAGSIGSGIGSGLVAHYSLKAMAKNPAAQGQVTIFMLIGQAWCQTGSIFALVISLLLLNTGGFAQLSNPNDLHLWSLIPISPGEMVSVGKYLGAGIGMGFGAIGSSIGIAFTAAMTCKGLASAPEAGAKIKSMFFVGAAVTETPVIFSLVVALILMIT